MDFHVNSISLIGRLARFGAAEKPTEWFLIRAWMAPLCGSDGAFSHLDGSPNPINTKRRNMISIDRVGSNGAGIHLYTCAESRRRNSSSRVRPPARRVKAVIMSSSSSDVCRWTSAFFPFFLATCVLFLLLLLLMFCRTEFHTCGCRPSDSYAGQVVGAGGRAPARFGAAPRQHGDLGVEVIAAADRRGLVFGVGAHVPLQVPPPPLPLELPLDLQ